MKPEYSQFLESKKYKSIASGFVAESLSGKLFDWQKVIVRWALRRGKAAVFADTGLGKTIMQIEWASQVARHTKGKVLIVAPLAVAQQTIAEGKTFGIADIQYIRSMQDMGDADLFITNYEMLKNINPLLFSGIVLDESSILKNETGKTRNTIIEQWAATPYRLSCTATPSPNDFTELGNQCQFLGIMSMAEMLSMFFINDSGDTGTWRLKKHGQSKFWEWMATWAVVIRRPSDIGYGDAGYDLPPLNIIEHEIDTGSIHDGELFARPAMSISEKRAAKRESIDIRCRHVAEMVNHSDESWIIWCHLNDESSMLSSMIKDAVEVKGADSIMEKESRLKDFTDGKYRVLISKASICGFGMNWQHTHNMAFVGMDDSFERFYQAIRRQWRFGQKNEVNVHIVVADTEGAIKQNIIKKQHQHDEISAMMVMHMKSAMQREITGAGVEKTEYNPLCEMIMPLWLETA